MHYRHCQPGNASFYASLALAGVPASVVAFYAMAAHQVAGWFFAAWCLLIALVLAAFARLRVEIESPADGTATLSWAMTFGWPSGCMPIDDIADARIVPIAWFRRGVGVSYDIFLRCWLWNVAFGKGVRIEKHNGSRIIIGTDDPVGLLAAIRACGPTPTTF